MSTSASESIFVGRRNELEQFEQYLFRSYSGINNGSSHRKINARVFLPYGIGGIGKTELTKQCLEIATKAGWQTIYLDWDRLPDCPNNFLDILDALADKLRSLDGGEKAIQTYLDIRKQALKVSERVERYRAENPEIWQNIVESSHKVATQLPTLETKALAFAATAALDYGPRLLALLADKMVTQKKLNLDEALLFKKPDTQLAYHIIQAFHTLAQKTGLVVALDTCEALSLLLEEMLRDILICPSVENATGLIFILAGRYSQYHSREIEGRYITGYADRLTDPPPNCLGSYSIFNAGNKRVFTQMGFTSIK
jgi:hypothetical protein